VNMSYADIIHSIQNGTPLPSYDVGTPYVPQDGPAYLHQGEAVLTKSENAARGSASQTELQALRQEVRDGFSRLIGVTVAHAQGSLAQGAEIADNTSRTKLDAMLAESAHR
jgi:hypothetical protein